MCQILFKLVYFLDLLLNNKLFILFKYYKFLTFLTWNLSSCLFNPIEPNGVIYFRAGPNRLCSYLICEEELIHEVRPLKCSTRKKFPQSTFHVIMENVNLYFHGGAFYNLFNVWKVGNLKSLFSNISIQFKV